MQSFEDQIVQIFLRYHDFVRGVAFRCYPYPGMVEDVTQQVYMELLAKKPKLDVNRDNRAFLALMTQNIAHALWRQRSKMMPEHLREIAQYVRQVAEEEPEDREEFELKRLALQHCLETIPEKSRDLIDMHYFHQLKMREIAQQLDLKTNTVCKAVARLRERLADCIKERLRKGETHVS